jgi:putative OPT family oligopeptide transporter
MVSGSLISALALTPLLAHIGQGLSAPLFPESKLLIAEMTSAQIWSRYVRYIGAGAVAAAGIVTVARSLPTMYASLRAVIGGVRGGDVATSGEASRTDRDLPGWLVLGLPASVILVLFAVPGLLAGGMPAGPRFVAALGIAFFGLAFVAVASRIVGLIGVSSNPTSGMTIVTLLGVASVFAALGWTGDPARAAVLTVGTVVCVAASIAGDTSQDLKTGQLVGATPAWQQLGQLIGVATACWVVAATLLLLHDAYTLGSPELPAPQATLMRTVIDGVLTGSLPWGLVGSGAALSLCAMLAGISGLSFAVGLYLPLATLAPIFVGGIVRRLADARREGPAPESDPGVLGASGMIAGEGLAGIAIALGAAARKQWPDAGWGEIMAALHFGGDRTQVLVTGAAGAILGLMLVGAVCVWLYRAALEGERDR